MERKEGEKRRKEEMKTEAEEEVRGLLRNEKIIKDLMLLKLIQWSFELGINGDEHFEIIR